MQFSTLTPRLSMPIDQKVYKQFVNTKPSFLRKTNISPADTTTGEIRNMNLSATAESAAAATTAAKAAAMAAKATAAAATAEATAAGGEPATA